MSKFQPHDFLFADRRLERRIVNYLVNQGRADLCKLRIRARGGIVHLRGEVPSVADRNYVLQGARRVAGVIDVEDAIQVRGVPEILEQAMSTVYAAPSIVPFQPAVLLSA